MLSVGKRAPLGHEDEGFQVLHNVSCESEVHVVYFMFVSQPAGLYETLQRGQVILSL